MRPTRLLFYMLVAVLALGGCDSPAGVGIHPVGVVLFDENDDEAARFIHQGAVTGRLTVGVGETATYTVRILDDDGEIVPVDGVEFSIDDPRVLIAHTARIRIENVDQIVVEGRERVDTTIRFQLFHGLHREWEAQNIPLVVE